MSRFVLFLLLITGLVTLLLCGNTELEDQVHYGGEEEPEDEGELEQGEDASAQEQAEAAADGAEEVHHGDGVELGDLRVQRLVEQLHEHSVILGPVGRQLPQLPGPVVTLLGDEVEGDVGVNSLLNAGGGAQTLDHLKA